MTSFIRQTVYQFALVLALGTLHAQLAPNMVKVCDEICTVTAAPANAVYQFGTGTSFSAPMTQSLPLLASCAAPGCPWFGGDPDVGIYKTLYVQQQATAFTVTWNNASGTVTTAIPGLPTAQLSSTVSATATASVPSTVTIPGQTATSTAPAIPAGTILCNVPKNGGACKTPSTITLTKPLVTTATQTVPITSGTQTLHFSCTGVPMLADGQPDLRAPLNCTVTQ